jgi:hypothetical protein
LCDSRLFLATSLDSLLTRVAIHTHVVDDFKVKILDRGIEGKIKYIVLEKYHASFWAIVMCVKKNIILEKQSWWVMIVPLIRT